MSYLKKNRYPIFINIYSFKLKKVIAILRLIYSTALEVTEQYLTYIISITNPVL